MKTVAMGLLLAMIASATGCGEKAAAPAGGAGEKEAAAGEESGTHVAEFRMGPSLGGNGLVASESDSFRPGDSVHTSFKVKHIPPGSTVKVVWSNSSKTKISEEEKPPGPNGAVTFELKDAGTLAEGAYLVEFFFGDPASPSGVGWSRLGEKSFRISR